MAWFIGQSILIIAAAFILGILVGWLIWGVWRRQVTVATAAAPASAAAPVAVLAAPVPAPAPDPEPAPEPELDPEPVAELDPEPEPALAEPEPVVAEPEPVVAAAEPEPEPVAEPEPALVVAESVTEAEAEREEEAAPEPEVVAEAEPVAETEGEPGAEGAAGAVVPVVMAAAEPDDVVDEDLERIEGIGPKMGEALRSAGIRSFAQLAATDEATLRTAIEARGLNFAPSLVTWARQAQLLADGDEEGFEDLTRRLVAGRDEGRQ